MKTTFDFNFSFLQSSQTTWIHINLETYYRSCQFSLFTCKHIISKKLIRNQNLNRKFVLIVFIYMPTTVSKNKKKISRIFFCVNRPEWQDFMTSLYSVQIVKMVCSELNGFSDNFPPHSYPPPPVCVLHMVVLHIAKNNVLKKKSFLYKMTYKNDLYSCEYHKQILT